MAVAVASVCVFLSRSIDGLACDTLFIRIIAYELYSMPKWALINLQLAFCSPINRLSFFGVVAAGAM